MNKYLERLYNGLIKENPTLVLMLGMCPTLAVSTAAINGIGMGLSTTAVLILSNFVISVLRRVIPNEVRLPAYIVIVASLVTVTELLIEAYLPSIYEALGIYIPLIVVNCIILGRAEAFANKNTVLDSALDAIGMGIGFTLALSLIALIRESFGSGTITFMAIGSWDGVIKVPFFNKWPVRVMSLAAGALLLMGYLKAFFNWNTARRSAKAQEGKA